MTIVAIHQPNYIPWLGYFHKIYECDIFVFLDNVKFSRGQVGNRNKIKVPSGWIWLTVPVKTTNKSGQLISEVQINNNINWCDKHFKSIMYSYRKAEYFNEYHEYLEKLYKKEWTKLADLNGYIIKNITSFLGIKRKFIKASELHVKCSGSELLINICKAVNADTYLSGIGATGYMDINKFKENGINVVYQDYKHPVYAQGYDNFISNMSIIDLLFNHGSRSLDILLGQ